MDTYTAYITVRRQLSADSSVEIFQDYKVNLGEIDEILTSNVAELIYNKVNMVETINDELTSPI